MNAARHLHTASPLQGERGTSDTPPEQDAPTQQVVKVEDLRNELADAVKHNAKVLDDYDTRHRPPGAAAFEASFRLALQSMNPGIPKGTVVLRDLKECNSDRILVSQCNAKLGKVLGKGGNGLVVEVMLEDTNTQKILGVQKFAVKFIYFEGKPEIPADRTVEFAKSVISGSLEEELASVGKVVDTVRANGHRSPTASISRENRWSLPLFEAVVGDSAGAICHIENLFFSGRVLLSEQMLGDATNILEHNILGAPTLNLSMGAREYLCKQFLSSLRKLHALGLVHFDVKPENILISSSGEAHVADFGAVEKEGFWRPCRSGVTPLYADPTQAECILRDGRMNADPLFDSWSAGVTVFQILTNGNLPFGLTPHGNVLAKLVVLDQSRNASYRSPFPISSPEEANAKKLREAGASEPAIRIVQGLLQRKKFLRRQVSEALEENPDWLEGKE
ncbi:hypothetical protein cyc_00989 [Cyclospora cayetanensis]|uniref:Protein kinase domain-containing protein n=1 Tax=Cyclospora cayetanensis TaxID=88456 RepID=A0A1D3D0P1_9EIME|nr:hypothetical protein cyc_00989 [Cyclospora cayetanensis]